MMEQALRLAIATLLPIDPAKVEDLLLRQRVLAVHELAALAREHKSTEMLIEACRNVEGVDEYRTGLERELATLESKLKACGDRILQLAAAPATDHHSGRKQ